MTFELDNGLQARADLSIECSARVPASLAENHVLLAARLAGSDQRVPRRPRPRPVRARLQRAHLRVPTCHVRRSAHAQRGGNGRQSQGSSRSR